MKNIFAVQLLFVYLSLLNIEVATSESAPIKLKSANLSYSMLEDFSAQLKTYLNFSGFDWIGQIGGGGPWGSAETVILRGRISMYTRQVMVSWYNPNLGIARIEIFANYIKLFDE